jgi:hypothetical protein
VAARAIVLTLLASFLLAGISRADDAPILPSRKASIVIPLLKAFNPKEGFTRIEKILGKEDVDVGNGIMDCSYGLDDGTSIRVRADPDGIQVLSIWREARKRDGVQVLYALSKAWKI